MKASFVKTANYLSLLDGVSRLRRRGARECAYLLVLGDVGLGKSAAIHRFAVDTAAVYVRAKSTWTKRGFLAELAEAMGLASNGASRTVQKRLLEHLSQRPGVIVLDEGDLAVARSIDVLESLRDITDATDMQVIIAGTTALEKSLVRFPQLASRVIDAVRFRPMTRDDVNTLCKSLSEVAIEDDLVERLYTQSAGYIRFLMNGIATVERFGKMSGLDQVSLATFGHTSALCNDVKPVKCTRKTA